MLKIIKNSRENLLGVTTISSRAKSLVLASFAAAVFLSACDTGPADSLYDPNRETFPDPVVSSVDPPAEALAGVDVVTITGKNFSAIADDNLVYFEDTKAVILSASPTVLTVLSPNTPGLDLTLKLSVIGAENFSAGILYDLVPASEEFGDITGFEEPFASTSDDSGNLLVSLNSDGRSVGVVRFAPDGTRSTFIETSFKWDSIQLDDNNLLYAVRSVRAIFRFEEMGSQQVWAVIPNSSVKLAALAFDSAGNLWAGGNNENIYSITPDKSIQASPFAGNVKALVEFQGNLYAAVTQNGESKIWKFTISGTGLGSAEEYFDVSGSYSAEALSLAFATNGDLFVGTDSADPVIVVDASGTGEILYPGVLHPEAISLAWGISPTLYMTQGRSATTTPNLIKIDTRREGAR